MKLFRCCLAIIWLFALIWLLNSRMGIIPPLGKIFSPATGFWQNAERRKGAEPAIFRQENIAADIVVRYDLNRVPHIFAGNDHDLYFAQGYVTAKDRLWEMEMSVRKASGTLAEIYGNQALGSDIFYRRIGLRYEAGKTFDSLSSDPIVKGMLEAYSEGVNAYIKTLRTAEFPVEYKIFDCRPAQWQPYYALIILKLMGEQLTGGESEFSEANAYRQMKPEALKELEQRSDDPYPVIPRNTPWDFKPLPLPTPPGGNPRNGRDSGSLHRTDDGSIVGSNGWVVDGKRARSGYPILANDPHMGLSFPSLWYQVQLNSSGVNVYGVSIPGIPCVIIGYNKNAAWGLTNTKADVSDWYHIKFKDISRNEYWYSGQWNKTTRRVETLHSRDGRLISDTIFYTRQGPVIYDGIMHRNRVYGGYMGPADGFALNWVLLYTSNDLKAFYLLNRADNYADYRKAVGYLSCPAQNVLFACADGDIAVVASGRFPIRYKGQGVSILDGSLRQDEWHGWIPTDEVPAIKNPGSGYIASANQKLTDSTYPYFIGGTFASGQRAYRLNTRLSSMSGIDVDSFRLLQMDSYSELARQVLPTMLARLDRSGVTVDARIRAALGTWDFRYSSKSVAATVFDAWWNGLMATSNIKNISSPQKETLDDLVATTFSAAIDKLIRQNGNLSPLWGWGSARHLGIGHISGIPAFGVMNFQAGGAPNTVDALTDRFGPSWRMIVELGPQVKGYGILPGGESGNPGSFFYDNSFAAWQSGKLEKLVFLNTRDERSDQVTSTITFKK
ncbi:MAG: penicillin acylase family protein [Chitinophagaceae bacterium]|nr:penicillin acylase family protein [Chitinophagaceae bacterium]